MTKIFTRFDVYVTHCGASGTIHDSIGREKAADLHYLIFPIIHLVETREYTIFRSLALALSLSLSPSHEERFLRARW